MRTIARWPRGGRGEKGSVSRAAETSVAGSAVIGKSSRIDMDRVAAEALREQQCE